MYLHDYIERFYFVFFSRKKVWIVRTVKFQQFAGTFKKKKNWSRIQTTVTAPAPTKYNGSENPDDNGEYS